MAVIPFQGTIALKLGSSNTYVTADDGGKVIVSPTCALVSTRNSLDVLALGNQAKRLEGRTSEDSMLVNPVSYGGVADSELCAMQILSVCEEATGKRRPFEKNKLVVTFPEGSTKVERAALINACQLAGAKRVLAIKAPLAAACMLDQKPDRTEGRLIVYVGSHITEVCVISAGAVVGARHLKTGSAVFDEAITRRVRASSGLVIAPYTAEALKKDIGSAVAPRSVSSQTLSGRSVRSGKPVTANISAQDIFEALQAPISEIVDSICSCLYNVPAQFSADVLKNGIYLTGGGADLYGLSQRLENETQLKVTCSGMSAHDCVLGAYKIAQSDRMTHNLISAQSAYEA